MKANEWRFLVDKLIGYMDDGTELHYVEIGGPSGVDKPTTTPAGHALCAMSLATESDSGKQFFYDETSGWVEQFTFKTA
jgi:hypothetical protein